MSSAKDRWLATYGNSTQNTTGAQGGKQVEINPNAGKKEGK
jgi:hypothetical protein